MTYRKGTSGLEEPRSLLMNSRAIHVRGIAWFAALVMGAAIPTVRAAECALGVIGVAFGDYDFLSPQDLEGAGTITVQCDSDTSYTIAMSPGAGSYETRRMMSGEHPLNYNLYTDVPRTIVWGDGSGGTQTIGGSDANHAYSVYAKVPAGQNPYVGTYTDNITVTLTF